MANKTYKIGDKLYRFVDGAGIFDYEVTGIRTNKEGESYELVCNTCSHGYKCEVLVGYDDYGNLKYICMLNSNDEDPQYMWHRSDGKYFLGTEKEALIDKCQRGADWYAKEIKTLQERIEQMTEKRNLMLNFQGDKTEFKKKFCV